MLLDIHLRLISDIGFFLLCNYFAEFLIISTEYKRKKIKIKKNSGFYLILFLMIFLINYMIVYVYNKYICFIKIYTILTESIKNVKIRDN